MPLAARAALPMFGIEASLEVDPQSLSQFQREVKALAAATHKAGAEVLREETHDLIKDVVATTPPFGRVAFVEDIANQFYIGKAAVRRDIRRVFRPVQTLRAWKRPFNARLKRELERAVGKGDVLAVAKILKLRPERVLAKADASIHQSARDEKGRVPQSYRWYVVLDEESIRGLEDETFKRIGRAKAGWEAAARAVGLDLPEWIARHSTPGRFRQVNGPEGPTIEIANDVEYADDFGELHILEKAIERSERRMEKKMEKSLGATFNSLGLG